MEEAKPQVVVLHNRPTEAAAPSETTVAAAAADVAAALESKGYRTEVAWVDAASLFRVVDGLAERRDTTAVFNLCGALDGDLRRGPLVAGLLDLRGVRYTGNHSATLATCLDKRITKALLFAAGIPTPGARVFRTTPTADGVRDMAFPLVLKPLRENASVGVTAEAFVRTPEELCERVEACLRRSRQPLLGEVYLSGREFNVSVAGTGRTAAALPASEVVFDGFAEDEPRLVTHDAKWEAGSEDGLRVRTRCHAEVGEHLKVSLATAALAAYRALECRDYARVDLRLNHRGTPHVLEVNPNPALGRKAGFSRTVAASGDSYEDFVERLVQWAWARG